MNREVKVIIPNMREFSTFYSDKEGVLQMFFKRDWVPVKEEHWKPSKEQMEALEEYGECKLCIKKLREQLKKL